LRPSHCQWAGVSGFSAISDQSLKRWEARRLSAATRIASCRLTPAIPQRVNRIRREIAVPAIAAVQATPKEWGSWAWRASG